MDMVQVSIELPREIFAALRQDPAGFVREMRVAAAVKMESSQKPAVAEKRIVSSEVFP